MRIPKHKQDFGQTLGVWGVGTGPYLVLPVLGPSSFRDTLGLVVDAQGNLVTHIDNVPSRNSLIGLRLINTRANLLNAGNLLDQAALDKYTFTRDIYLQRRGNLSGDDKAPVEERFDLPADDPVNRALTEPNAPVAPATPAP